jgi:uncharacterized paraquat-inducible protein A
MRFLLFPQSENDVKLRVPNRHSRLEITEGIWKLVSQDYNSGAIFFFRVLSFCLAIHHRILVSGQQRTVRSEGVTESCMSVTLHVN